MQMVLHQKRRGDCFNRIIPFTRLTPLAGFCFGVCLLDLAWLLPGKRRVDFYRFQPVREDLDGGLTQARPLSQLGLVSLN